MSSLDNIRVSRLPSASPIVLNLTLSTKYKIHTVLSAATLYSSSRARLEVQALDAPFPAPPVSRPEWGSDRQRRPSPTPLVRKAGGAGALCSEATVICVSNQGPQRCPSALGGSAGCPPPFLLTWLNLRPAEASEAVPGRAQGGSLAERVEVGDRASAWRVFALGHAPGTFGVPWHCCSMCRCPKGEVSVSIP